MSTSVRSVIASAVVLIAAITVLLALLVSRATAAPGSGGAGHDNSDCRPTKVVRYC